MQGNRSKSNLFEANPKNVELAVGLYKQNKSINLTAKHFGVSTSYMWKVLNQNQADTICYPCFTSTVLHLSQDIIHKYVNENKGSITIARELSVSHQGVIKLITAMGLIRDIFKVSNTLNHNWLDNIDSEYKAYFLGWMASDGSITKNELSISVQEQDKYILEELGRHINPHIVVKTYPPYNKSATCLNQARLVITSKQWVDRLKQLNITERKSLTLKAVASLIPQPYVHHFIRGVFDGDGCISLQKVVSISGTRTFLEDIITNIGIPTTVRAKGNIADFAYHSKFKVNSFKNYIYDNATIYLKRKYDKFNW